VPKPRLPSTPTARAFRGVGAEPPGPGSPERQAWAQRVTYLTLGAAASVAVATGIAVGVLADNLGWALIAAGAGFLVVMLIVCLIIVTKDSGPPRPFQ
jgi:hypothetical protein